MFQINAIIVLLSIKKGQFPQNIKQHNCFILSRKSYYNDFWGIV